MKRALETISDGVLKVQKVRFWLTLCGLTVYGYAHADMRICAYGYAKYADTDMRIRIRGYGYADTDMRIRICRYGYANTDMQIWIRGCYIIYYIIQK